MTHTKRQGRALTDLTMRFEGGLTITIWPQWSRVAMFTPFMEALTLSLGDFGRAVRLARKARRRAAK